MAEKTWEQAKIEGIESQLNDQKTILQRVAVAIESIATHDNRIQIVECNQSDHEDRLRSIEKLKWVVVLLTVFVSGFMAYIGKASADMMVKAQEQKPITSEQLQSAIVDAIVKASNSRDKQDQ